MRNPVREFRAVPTELVPAALRGWTALPFGPLPTPPSAAVDRPRRGRPCQMMMIVDLLSPPSALVERA